MGIYRWLNHENHWIHSFIPTFTYVDTGKNLGGRNKKLHSNRLLLIGEGIQAALECSSFLWRRRAFFSILAEDAEVQDKFFELWIKLI